MSAWLLSGLGLGMIASLRIPGPAANEDAACTRYEADRKDPHGDG